MITLLILHILKLNRERDDGGDDPQPGIRSAIQGVRGIPAQDLRGARRERDEAQRIVDVPYEEVLVCCAQVVVDPRQDHQYHALVSPAQELRQAVDKRD